MVSKQNKLTASLLLLCINFSVNAFTINLDYSYDNGFFNNATRLNAMDSAASFFEARITDSFGAITSSGINSMTARFFDPGIGDPSPITDIISVQDFSVGTDAITVFVGGSDMATGFLAWGGVGGYTVSNGSDQVFRDSIENRGPTGITTGSNADEFTPWGGSISFDNSGTTWDFDSSDGISGFDFFSVAIHELGHVLGLGIADSWDSLVNTDNEGKKTFTGNNSRPVYGSDVPLTDDGAHWEAGTDSYVNGVLQEAAMDPNIGSGIRKEFTDLDMAALDDIGWEIAPVPLPPALLLFGSGLLGFLGLRRHQRQLA